MTLCGLLLLAAFIMKAWPNTGFARWLRLVLIDYPLSFLAGIKRRHLVFLIVGFAVLYSCALAGMPHLGMLVAVDVSAYVDAVMTVWTIAALSRSRGALTAIFARLPRLRSGKPRQRRARRTVRREASNDDEGHRGFALAA